MSHPSGCQGAILEQEKQHQGPCQKCTFSGPTSDLHKQKHWGVEPCNLHLATPKWFWCIGVWESIDLASADLCAPLRLLCFNSLCKSTGIFSLPQIDQTPSSLRTYTAALSIQTAFNHRTSNCLPLTSFRLQIKCSPDRGILWPYKRGAHADHHPSLASLHITVLSSSHLALSDIILFIHVFTCLLFDVSLQNENSRTAGTWPVSFAEST